jgi:cbb3-type cytochrome oxidase subunit 3
MMSLALITIFFVVCVWSILAIGKAQRDDTVANANSASE